MEFNTPQAMHEIKESKKPYAIVDGKKQSLLEAMSYAFQYHTVDVSMINNELRVSGTCPVNSR